MTTLHELGMKHGTDKAIFHNYMHFYEKHIDPKTVKRFLEIGIFTGSSIKTWREWFPKGTVVEGWDINSSSPIDGCDLRVVDQLNKEQMLKNITGVYDVILDDGGHTARMIQTSMSVLFPHAKMYILEDLHAPWCGSGYMEPEDINTLDVIENFNVDGWNSPYATDEQREYINQYAEVVGVFVRGDRDKPDSAAAIIKNKDKNVQGN
jgi:hypothetical protein